MSTQELIPNLTFHGIFLVEVRSHESVVKSQESEE